MKRPVFIVLSGLLLTVASIVVLAVTSGTWSGTTSQSRAFGFVVDSTGNTITQISYSATGCGTITSTITATVPISNNAFSIETGGICPDAHIAGTFSSSTAASGTMTLYYTYIPYACSCSGSQSLTWTAAPCTMSISPTSATAPAAGSTGNTIAVTACSSSSTWTAITSYSASSWLSITSGSSGTGSGTVTYSVAANTGRVRTGTIMVAGQTFTVTQSSSMPSLTPSPTTLKFGAVNSGGGTLTSKTGSQDVTLTQTGTGTVPWTATSDQPWLIVTSGSGTGTGKFTVSVASSAVLPATGTVTGTITVSAAAAGSDPTIPVSMTLAAPSTTAPPFGQIDTPTQSAVGVVGAIGVTGWAIDDVGVSNVKIYRNCLAFDNPASCQVLSGNNVVYIGDAAFLAGARPDVETAFSSYPQAYRGGWGYLMLTNMLPDVTNSQAYGGQGTLTIYAYATDGEGQRTLLGRTQTDHTPTTITMANATIAKPFGAIDTPGQGQTVSGTLANFGWALTPDSNTSADATDILIPTDGSTMVVFLDSVSTALVAYNQCRGNVGNPVPAGVYCNDDVANIFGNTTPKDTLTARTSNPTKHRNLDAGRSAIGAYNIDTTAMTNGLHTIAWSVTDSNGRNEGIGSRFFTVLNGSSDRATLKKLLDAPAQVLGQVTDVTWRPLTTGAVWGRSGFDLRAAWETIEPDSAGTRHVRMPELGRVELDLGAGVTMGYLVVDGTLRPLPPGSQVTTAGRFAWAPPVGYFGTYDLVFIGTGGQVPVTVTIQPASDASHVDAYIDRPRAGETVRGTFEVAGWAADPTAWNGTGIGAVHVWAHRRDADAEPIFLGAADLNGWRPDVGVAAGAQFERAGWGLTAPALPPGEYDIVAYFWSVRTARFEDARVVRISVR